MSIHCKACYKESVEYSFSEAPSVKPDTNAIIFIAHLKANGSGILLR